MTAALSVGRVGGLAVALGVGAAVLYGAAVASAEASPQESSSRSAAASTASPSAGAVSRGSGRSAPTPVAASGGAERAAAVSAVRAAPPNRAVSAGQASARASTGLPQADVATQSGAGAAPRTTVGALAPAEGGVTAMPAPAFAVSAAGRAEAAGSVRPAAGARSTADASVSAGPDPLATVSTPYGDLGKWMLRDGAIANWVDLPLCDDGGVCKTVQEPINMVFVVEASSKWAAQLQLDHSLRRAQFGPSPFSSIGYSGIVDGVLSGQMPHGGIFGFGLIPPLPFDLGSGPGLIPLLAPLGFGAAYRDAPFWEANAHLRTFGGITDGDGKYIFTASVSDEYLISTGGLLPTHAYESFVDARTQLAANMVAIGATELGTIDMQNEISASDPDFTTGDHDGNAVVIGIAPRSAPPSPVRRLERGDGVRNPVAV